MAKITRGWHKVKAITFASIRTNCRKMVTKSDEEQAVQDYGFCFMHKKAKIEKAIAYKF